MAASRGPSVATRRGPSRNLRTSVFLALVEHEPALGDGLLKRGERLEGLDPLNIPGLRDQNPRVPLLRDATLQVVRGLFLVYDDEEVPREPHRPGVDLPRRVVYHLDDRELDLLREVQRSAHGPQYTPWTTRFTMDRAMPYFTARSSNVYFLIA